jgi:hypothetical protein
MRQLALDHAQIFAEPIFAEPIMLAQVPLDRVALVRRQRLREKPRPASGAEQVGVRARWDEMGVRDRSDDGLQPGALPRDLVAPCDGVAAASCRRRASVRCCGAASATGFGSRRTGPRCGRTSCSSR